MQIADVQEVPSICPDTLKLMRLAIAHEKPDLIVFTGDQIQGYGKEFRKGDAEKLTRQLIQLIVLAANEAGVPFAVTFGNHDMQCGVPNARQMEMYKEYPLCVHGEPRCKDDMGTYSLRLHSSDGERAVFNLYIFDSNGISAHDGYLPVSAEQIEWYRAERESIKEKHGEYLPSFVFQHIPVPEVYDGLKRVRRFTKGSIPAFRSHAHEYYKLTEEQMALGHFLREAPAPPDNNSGQFDALCEKGEVLGVFFGHDHINSFVTSVKGIDLAYTQGTGFNVYGPGRERGVRVLELSEDNLRSYKTHTITFDELCRDKLTNKAFEFVYGHAPLSLAKWAYSHIMSINSFFPNVKS